MFGIPFAVFGSLVAASLLVDDMLMKKVSRRVKMASAVFIIGAFTCLWLFGAGAPDWGLLLGLLYIAAFFGTLFGSDTYRTMLYIPNFASGVATIILWVQIFNPHYGLANGIIESVFSFFGLHPELPTWLTSTKNLLGFLPLPNLFSNGGFGFGAREAIIIMGFWMGIGGNNMILYIASISNIPTSLYEAAEVDGAGPISKFWHITIPSVAATTFFISVMATIGGLQGGFANARIMTQGGPAGITTTLSYYIFTSGFEELRLGYASAVSWVMFAIIFTLTLLNWKYGNKQNEYQ
jgi:multiple sugar transport system permease protein